MPEKYYIDIDYNLTKNSLSNDVSVKYDLNAIAQSIKNIILTTKKEKIFNSTFGGNAFLLNFENLRPFTLDVIKRQFSNEINLQEPRAVVNNINIKNDNLGYWSVDISFSAIFDNSLIKTITIPLE